MRPSPKNQTIKKSDKSFFEGENFSILELSEYVSRISKLLNEIENVKGEYKTLFENQELNYKNLKNDSKKQIDNELAKLKSKFQFLVQQVIKKAKHLKGDPGDKGDDYVLTKEDKLEIASMIEPSRIETVTKETVIKEVPVIKETKIEVENKLTKQQLIEFLKELPEKIFEIKHINTLEERLRSLGTNSGGFVGGGQGSWKQKHLIGNIDGVNRVFTFTGEEPAIYSERVFLNYLEQNPFTDYAISYQTMTVTYTTAPDATLSGLPHIIRYM